MRGLFRKVPDRGSAVELRAAIEAVDARLTALSAAAAGAEERRSALALAAAAGEKEATVQLARLKSEAAQRAGESEDLERARRRLADDLAESERAAGERAAAAAWRAVERQLEGRRSCAVELERCLAQAGELWRRYDALGQAAFAAVPAAARERAGGGARFQYLQPPARGTTVGDYSLAQALAAAGLGIAWGTHLPSAHDLVAWRGLPAEAEDIAQRLLALR